MGTKKRTEITIEMERVVIHAPAPTTKKSWCLKCAAQVDWLTPESAAQIINVAPRSIYRWVEAGQLHFLENPDGALLICQNSLFGEHSAKAVPPNT